MSAIRDISVRSCVPALLIVACFGCANVESVDATSAIAIGKATLDGDPITGGMITVISHDNPSRRATGILRPDGTFRLAGAPLGKCRVVIDTTSVQAGDPANYMPVPAKYHAAASTSLFLDLKPGPNDGIHLQCEGS